MKRYYAACETQSYGHYSEMAACGHAHKSFDAALDCASRWERGEERINRPYREAGVQTSNGARYVVIARED
jgi:hypothetical protein